MTTPTQLQTEQGIWQKVLESGGFLVGEEVKILVDVSAVKAT